MTRNDVMTFLRENAYPYYQDAEVMHLGEWQDKMYNAVFQSLPESLLAEVTNQLLLERDCPKVLFNKAQAILSRKVELKSATVPTRELLRAYQDKGSKKVSWAMKELMRRFRGEDRETQRKILRAFLQGGKKDLEWAGRQLRDNWIPSFAPLVAKRWKETHNRILAFVVLRHMPLSFVLEQQEELASATTYAIVCARLGFVKGFRLDSERLTIPEYFYVMAKLNASQSQVINTPVVIEFMLQEYLDEENQISEEEIKTILWAMGKLGMTEGIFRFKPVFDRYMKMNEEQSRLFWGEGDF